MPDCDKLEYILCLHMERILKMSVMHHNLHVTSLCLWNIDLCKVSELKFYTFLKNGARSGEGGGGGGGVHCVLEYRMQDMSCRIVPIYIINFNNTFTGKLLCYVLHGVIWRNNTAFLTQAVYQHSDMMAASQATVFACVHTNTGFQSILG